jgi:SAM-dependent methyltransferase
MKRAIAVRSADYETYLNVQLARTVFKRDVALPDRARELIDEVARRVDLTRCDVLCVGCRNAAEIDCLAAHGARRVVGIDLYSESDRIMVMDMHQLTFEDGSFDLVYSSHSLEHALEPRRVAREFVRVLRPGGYAAIEVPVRYETRGSDLHDFGSAQGVLDLFGSAVHDVLWSDNPPPGTALDASRSLAARAIFQVRPSGPEFADHGGEDR